MLAEIFTGSEYHAGRDLIPASPANPHGFFEDIRVNRRNDELMASLELTRHGQRLPRDLWWMEAFDGPVQPCDQASVDELVPSAPFVMKDPRFVYTGPAWTTAWSGGPSGARTAVVPSALVVVVVRPVGEVARSLETMRTQQPDVFTSLASSEIELGHHVVTMWRAMYRSVLAWVDADAVFVTEASVRDGSALVGLGRIAGATLTTSTIDPTLHRSTTNEVNVPLLGSPDHDPDGVDDQVVRRVRRDAERLRRAAQPSAAASR